MNKLNFIEDLLCLASNEATLRLNKLDSVSSLEEDPLDANAPLLVLLSKHTSGVSVSPVNAILIFRATNRKEMAEML